jgi:hypothetical protein
LLSWLRPCHGSAHRGSIFKRTCFVVVCACLILWVLTALDVGMLAVGAMQMAWLVELTLLRGGLTIHARTLLARGRSFEVATITVASRSAIESRPAIALIGFFLVQSADQKQINHTQRSSQPGHDLAPAWQLLGQKASGSARGALASNQSGSN